MTSCEDLPWEKLLDKPTEKYEQIRELRRWGYGRWLDSLPGLTKRHWYLKKYQQFKDVYEYDELLGALVNSANGRLDGKTCIKMLDCLIHNNDNNPSVWYSPNYVWGIVILEVSNGQDKGYKVQVEPPFDI